MSFCTHFLFQRVFFRDRVTFFSGKFFFSIYFFYGLEIKYFYNNSDTNNGVKNTNLDKWSNFLKIFPKIIFYDSDKNSFILFLYFLDPKV